jgi:FkbM family methyltransferase
MASEHKYYSQFGEDYLLWRLFEGRNDGFSVDIGAFDGVHLSNSYSFELEGWSGICVEASPRYIELCRKQRPGSICIHAACVGDENIERIELYTEELGLLSGVSPGREREVSQRYANRGLKFNGFSKVSVPAITLNRLLREHLPRDTQLDFLSIDVEGTELDILRAMDLEGYRPRVLVVEANTPAHRLELDNYLINERGYHFARMVSINAFYTDELTDALYLSSVKLQCQLQVQKHPLGEQYTPRRFRNGSIIME